MTEQTLMVGSQRLEASSSSENDESLCQEDIQKLLGLKQSLVSLDKWDVEWQRGGGPGGGHHAVVVSTTGV